MSELEDMKLGDVSTETLKKVLEQRETTKFKDLAFGTVIKFNDGIRGIVISSTSTIKEEFHIRGKAVLLIGGMSNFNMANGYFDDIKRGDFIVTDEKVRVE